MMRFGFMAAVATAASLGTPADAATITQYRGISTLQPFDGFSASLGTLDSVTLEVTVRTYRQWFVQTPSGSPANTITWSINSYFDVLARRGGSALTGFPLRVATSDAGELVQNSGVFNFSAVGTGLFTLDPSLFSDAQPISISHSDPGLSVPSESGTTISASVAGSTLLQTLGSCGFGVTSAGCGFGGATLTYNYTPGATAVPEPATWAMMIGGFGLVGAVLRRARRRATRVSFA